MFFMHATLQQELINIQEWGNPFKWLVFHWKKLAIFTTLGTAAAVTIGVIVWRCYWQNRVLTYGNTGMDYNKRSNFLRNSFRRRFKDHDIVRELREDVERHENEQREAERQCTRF